MRSILFSALLLLALGCGGSSENLFSGTIEIDEVRISARLSGAVEELNAEQGDRIEIGQTLIRIDPTEYQLALTQAEAALAIAEANLATITEGAREQQVITASSAVSAARTVNSQAQADLARAEELAEAGAISDQQLQASQTGAAHAHASYITAQQNYSLAVEGARVSELDAAEAAVESATAARDIAQRRVQWTTITSPLTGSVTGTNIEKGENITPGVTLLTVSCTDSVKAVFFVSQPYLATTDIGSTVIVSTTSLNDSYEATGTITHISDSAEFTPSQVETREGRTSLVYRVEAEFSNPQNVFKAGMPVDVEMGQNP